MQIHGEKRKGSESSDEVSVEMNYDLNNIMDKSMERESIGTSDEVSNNVSKNIIAASDAAAVNGKYNVNVYVKGVNKHLIDASDENNNGIKDDIIHVNIHLTKVSDKTSGKGNKDLNDAKYTIIVK